MAKERDDNAPEEGELVEKKSKHRYGNPSKRDQFGSEGESSDSDDGKDRRRKKKSSSKSRSRKRRRRSSSDSDEYDSSSESSYLDSGSVESSESDGSESEQDGDEVRRKKKKERRRKRGKEEERERRMKEKEKRRKEKEKEKKRKEKKKKEEKKKKKKEKDTGKTGAVTNSWGKYGVIRETDMWNKRPEFTAWLAEVKQVNMESLANWEEKQMFREFMEDHNTATFPSTKYYNLDAYQQRQRIKEMKKYLKSAPESERTVFNDEELRRQELLRERERQKEEQVETLKRSMQSGMAQAMKEQAQLREEMAYQYKLGNFEAAAAIQRRLDPDVAM